VTAAEFQSVALRLSESSWVRVWPKWTGTITTLPEGAWLMAMSLRGGEAWSDETRVRMDLFKLGFRATFVDDIGWVHVAERTNDDGTPYTGAT
jgi:hypothetical protein